VPASPAARAAMRRPAAGGAGASAAAGAIASGGIVQGIRMRLRLRRPHRPPKPEPPAARRTRRIRTTAPHPHRIRATGPTVTARERIEVTRKHRVEGVRRGHAQSACPRLTPIDWRCAGLLYRV